MTFIFQTNITLLNTQLWDTINSLVDIGILSVLMLKIVFEQKYKLVQMVYIGFISIFAIISVFCSGEKTFLATWIFILASKNIDYDSLFMKIYKVQLILTILVIVFFMCGVIQQSIVYRENSVMPRFSLGFGHPNILGFSIALIFILRFAIGKVKKIWEIIPIALASAFVFLVPNSKSSGIVLLILIIVILCNWIAKRKLTYRAYKSFLNVFIIISGFLNVFSIFLMIIGTKYAWSQKFDRFFSYRLSYGNSAYKYFGITLLGNNLGQADWLVLDNAYMVLVLRYGMVIYFIFSIMYLATMRYLKGINEKYMLVMFLLSVYGCMESSYISVGGNVFIMLMGLVIYLDKRKKFDVRQGRN